jgi:hypothetical protein
MEAFRRGDGVEELPDYLDLPRGVSFACWRDGQDTED